MNKTKFLKYCILILLITISVNLLLFSFLPDKINLIFSIKPNGSIRSNVNKVIALLFFPLLIMFTFLTGYINKKYTIIVILTLLFLIIDLFVMTINLIG